MNTNARLRRFPFAGWAWPNDSRDLLLQAALLPDTSRAQAALSSWLSTHDLDEIGFHDHRLLAAISERHGRDLTSWPEAPRLKGLQRQLWTQSRMRVHAVLPILQTMKAAGIHIMLLKGAARIALRPEAQRQRAHQDVDILVPSDQMGKAAQVLSDAGWQTARGDSALAAIARAPGARAINFQMLPWGDIDLHRTAWHGNHVMPELDAALWRRASQADYFGIPVLVPEAAERLAMTLSHGAWSPESHSDWLVDAADILGHDEVDWHQFKHIASERKLESQIRIGLSYLHHVIGLDFPPDIISQLHKACAPSTLLIGKPASELNLLLRSLRQISHVYKRRQRAESSPLHTPPLKLALAQAIHLKGDEALLQADVKIPQTVELASGTYRFKADVVMQSPACQRRIELELHGEGENLARFRIYAKPSKTGFIQARIMAKVHIKQSTTALKMQMRPGKLLPAQPSTHDAQRYGALPFALHDVRVESQCK